MVAKPGPPSPSISPHRRPLRWLPGTWKSVKRTGTARSLIYNIPGDHVLLTYPGTGQSIEAKPDGTPSASKGPDIAPGDRESITLESPNRIHIVGFIHGKPAGEVIDRLNPDGRSFTSVNWLIGKENEKTTSTFLKQ